MPEAWQLVHWVFTLSVPVRQLRLACPPWQLTLEQVNAVELNDAEPVFALYVVANDASPGGTLPPAPVRPLARL